MIYCVDSNIIVWGIKKQATPGQEEMIARAEALFQKMDEHSDEIIIPTIVLAEILAPETPNVRARYVDVLERSFIVAPFDTRAALLYAQIMHDKFSDLRDISQSTGIPRQKIKADHMIIATAIVNNANCIYSTDNGLRTFAAGYIDVRDLPPIRQQTTTPRLSQPELFNVQNTTSEKEKDEETPF